MKSVRDVDDRINKTQYKCEFYSSGNCILVTMMMMILTLLFADLNDTTDKSGMRCSVCQVIFDSVDTQVSEKNISVCNIVLYIGLHY